MGKNFITCGISLLDGRLVGMAPLLKKYLMIAKMGIGMKIGRRKYALGITAIRADGT